MRIKSRLVLDFDNEKDASAFYSFTGAIPPCELTSNPHVLELFVDSLEYQKVKKFLEDDPPDYYGETKEEVFSEQELLDAPLLRMVPNAHRGGYPQPEGGPRESNFLSRSYDLTSGCPTCSKGLLQDRPLRLGGGISLGKKNDISGIWWTREYVVTQKLKDIIEAAGLTGCEFWPIIKHGANKPFEHLFQLKIIGELPPMAKETVFKHGQLSGWGKRCEHGCGMVSIEGRIHYRAADLIDMPDFALTQEWMGVNYEFWRWPFMSQRAYRLFLDNNIRGIRYYPPAIVE